MKCVICRHGETQAGAATIVLERDGACVVFRSVPADVCDNCGEEYVDDRTAARLLEDFEEALGAGIEIDVRHYAVV